jgi:hypothetical protein
MKILLALWALAELAGCADPHLGDFYGRRTRAALDAQAQAASGGDSPGTLDADDAKVTLARQRGRAVPGTAGAAQAVPPLGAYGFGGAGGAGMVGGSTGGVPSSSPSGQLRLDAVR